MTILVVHAINISHILDHLARIICKVQLLVRGGNLCWCWLEGTAYDSSLPR